MRVRGAVCQVVIAGVVVALVGCGGSGGGQQSPAPTPTPTPAVVNVYVIQEPATFGSGSASILQFPATSSGSVSATTTLTAPMNTSFEYLATDGSGNLYVSTSVPSTAGDVRVYAAGATGAATPTRTLPGGSTTMIGAVQGLAASAAGEIFVSEDSGGVAAFSATANGSVAPSRYILGAVQMGGGLSTLISANDVAADSSDNLYIANEGAPGLMPVAVFAPTATGNVAPARTLGGAATTISLVSGMTTDSAGNLYIAGGTVAFSGTTAVYTGSILEFASGATGNAAPMRTITGASTTLGRLGGIKLDAAGNIYVVSVPSTGSTPTVLKFASTATGNVAPTSSFTSPAWTLPDNGYSLAVF